MKNPALDPGYLRDVERAMVLIPKWCEQRDRLPDLRFWTFGSTMFIAALSERRWLAISDDAFELLRWLDEQTGHRLTIFQVHFALEQLGYLVGAPVLTMNHLRELGCTGTILSAGGEG